MPKRATKWPNRAQKRPRNGQRPERAVSTSFLESNLGRIGAGAARDVAFLAPYAWAALLPLLGDASKDDDKEEGHNRNFTGHTRSTTSLNGHFLSPIGQFEMPENALRYTKTLNITENYSPKTPKKLSQVPSLRRLASLAIASNIHSIEKTYLRLAPWECWKMVWERVLALNKDSLEVFRIFASRFGEEAGFKCHGSSSSYIHNAGLAELACLRAQTIKEYLIPGSEKHRMENLFANVSIPDFLSYLRGLSFTPRVLLDLSQRASQMLREDHFLLLSLPHLVGLDLSNSRIVDDHFLYNMATAITRDEKLTQLTILRLQNCPLVTEKGLHHLFGIQDHLQCSLSYIESDVKVTTGFLSKFGVKSGPSYITGTRWRPLTEDDPFSSTVSRLPLALKLHCLYRNFASNIIVSLLAGNTTTSPLYLLRSQKAVLLDVMFHSEEFSSSDVSTSSGIIKLQRVWEARLASRNRLPKKLPICYIVDNSHEPLTQQNPVSKTPPQESSAVFHVTKRKPSSTQRTPKRKKPIGIRTTAESFFNT